MSGAQFAQFSRLMDEHAVVEGPMHLLRLRCSKLHEEAGEVEEALVAVECSNPRKSSSRLPEDYKRAKLGKELLDVAHAAVCAYEHLTDNRGLGLEALEQHGHEILARIEATIYGLPQ